MLLRPIPKIAGYAEQVSSSLMRRIKGFALYERP